MKLKPRLMVFTPSALLPLAAIVLAGAIFVADTITDLEIAVPVFYTAVVLMSVQFCSRRGVVLIGLGCVALTILSDLFTPGRGAESGVINTIISILAIIATTYLVLKIDTAEQAVSDARTKLAHAARVTALGELTASIAHEVNQPIAATVMNGTASLRWLAADPPDLEKARATLERIVKDATRAGEIVGRVRGLAKRTPPKMGPCDINDVIRGIVALTANEIEKHRISVITDLDQDLGTVYADPVQLQQVMLNLVLNAIEAMDDTPEGAVLSIRSIEDAGGNVVVSVRDSGKGLGPIRPEQVFDAFYTTKPSGMGLGLTITRSIVEAHGGKISAEANDWQGAIFRFTLPIAKREG